MWIFKKNREHIELEALSEYLDARLSLDERQKVELHLGVCSRCGEELASLRQTVGLLKRVPMESPRQVFALGETPYAVPTSQRRRLPTWAYGAATSMAVMLFALVLSADLGGLLAREAAAPDLAARAEEASQAPTAPPQATMVTEEEADMPSPGTSPPSAQVKEATGQEDMLQAEAAPPQLTAQAPVSAADTGADAVAEPALPQTPPEEDAVEDGVTPTPLPTKAPVQTVQPDDSEEVVTGEPAEVPIPEAETESTAAIWRVLEGVIGAAALLLVVGAIWRTRSLWRRTST